MGYSPSGIKHKKSITMSEYWFGHKINQITNPLIIGLITKIKKEKNYGKRKWNTMDT
jgi:hypothetical protein